MPALPLLNENNIKLWLTQVEMMARDVGLTEDRATFYAIASRLLEKAANAAADILEDPAPHCRLKLRGRLEQSFSKSTHQAIHNFLANTKRDKGEQPTAHLRRLVQASNKKATDPILLNLLLESLPASLKQTLLQAQVETAQDAADAADEALTNEPSTMVAAVTTAAAMSATDAKLDKLTVLIKNFFPVWLALSPVNRDSLASAVEQTAKSVHPVNGKIHRLNRARDLSCSAWLMERSRSLRRHAPLAKLPVCVGTTDDV